MPSHSLGLINSIYLSIYHFMQERKRSIICWKKCHLRDAFVAVVSNPTVRQSTASVTGPVRPAARLAGVLDARISKCTEWLLWRGWAVVGATVLKVAA